MVEYKHEHHLQEEDEEEQLEEALSLRDLLLDASGEDQEDPDHDRRSTSSPEFFEFFSNHVSASHQMSSAEDIISSGKLLPLKDLTLPPPIPDPGHNRRSPFRRRSESLSAATYRSDNSTLMMRNSRSLDYRRLEMFSSSKTTSFETGYSLHRDPSVGKGDIKRTAKPRWYFLLFGVVKAPAEMELGDIKSRQYRRNPSSIMFLPSCVSEKSEKPPVSKVSYKLLDVLSCRDITSVAATTSFRVPPQAIKNI